MEPTIFRFIWKYSLRQQLIILALTVGSFPVLYATLELPKIIINKALAVEADVFYLFGRELTQLQYLLALCAAFLGLVLVAGILKYFLNVYAGIVAERMLRRLRYQLYDHLLRFPLPYFRRMSQGELVQMINAEVEPLGGYVGSALSVPAFQGGTLITILVFMFMQDWVLGLAAVALYPVQAYVIPKLQRQVNELGKRRVRQVRHNAEKISETAGGVIDIHANDTSLYERAQFSEHLSRIFFIRFDIYKKKFLIKFLNNFLAQLGPFFFFSIGGYLVLEGQITLGALVAVLNAHKDLSAPWKELLTYYQTMYDVKIKYEQIVTQFMPAGLKPAERQLSDPPADAPEFADEIVVQQVGLEEDGEWALDGVSFSLRLPGHVAVLGNAGSGRGALAQILAGLIEPSRGRVLVDGKDLHAQPESVLGRRIGYVAPVAHVFKGTIADNLLYGLKHRPIRPRPADAELERYLYEAVASGNAAFDPFADWVDDAEAGVPGPQERLPAMMRVLELVQLDHDVYLLGLRGTIRAAEKPDLANGLLRARQRMFKRLSADPTLARLVEPFDPDRYNTNASLAENLLFGTPVGDTFGPDRVAENPYVLETVRATGLFDDLVRIGYRVASTMVELFADLPPEHEYFRQFSFIDPERLPQYRALIQRVDPDHPQEMSEEDQRRLLALAFRLIPARHRLGLLTPEIQERVIEARRRFRANLPPELEGTITFFDRDAYNDALSIQENVIFGKVAYGQANAAARVAALIRQILDELDLALMVRAVGLDFECGVGGSRLNLSQRQKLAIARELLKHPRVLILHNATDALDAAEQVALRDSVLREFEGRTVFWVLNQHEWASRFDKVLIMDGGRVSAFGRFDQLRDGNTPLGRLLAAI